MIWLIILLFNWSSAQGLRSHNWWHYGLYHIERNEFEKAEQILEEKCIPICLKERNVFSIFDCTSFLYRLQLFDEQNSRDELWAKIHPRIESNLDGHAGEGFGDMHLMMSCLANKRYDQAEQLIESLDKERPLYSVSDRILNALYSHERGKRWPSKKD